MTSQQEIIEILKKEPDKWFNINEVSDRLKTKKEHLYKPLSRIRKNRLTKNNKIIHIGGLMNQYKYSETTK